MNGAAADPRLGDRHPEGVIVVDTGETARASQPGYFVLTHMHTDHAGGLAEFPDSEVLVLPDRWPPGFAPATRTPAGKHPTP